MTSPYRYRYTLNLSYVFPSPSFTPPPLVFPTIPPISVPSPLSDHTVYAFKLAHHTQHYTTPHHTTRDEPSESLYNISKVARSSVLQYFNPIFDGLCKLFAHVDVDVKNGANLLDRLIKDIVTESDVFHVESFIPLLQKNIKRTKPYIRQLIVGWIVVLNAVPDINMLDYLPEFLDGLFNMLSDNNREIQLSANNALSDFLREIKQAEVSS